LRAAKSNDIWRKLFRRADRRIAGLKVEYADTLELGTGELLFKHPINLICGENGAGKSAALWIIAKALGIDRILDGSHRINRPKADTGTITRGIIYLNSVGHEPQEQTLEDEFRTDVALQKLALIDTGTQIPHLLSALRSDTNPQDLIEGITPIDLKADEIAQIRQLTGKEYTKVDIYEIEDYAEFPLFPFFSATYGTATYSTTAMGLGEFALLYLYWKLRSLPAESVVLIEEPESFAAPRSQRVFIDFLAALCSIKGHFFILSSHSGIIAERIPNVAIQLCSRIADEVAFVSDPAPSLLADRISLYLRRRLIALVEDEAAKFFLRSIIEHLDARVGADVDILISGSSGKISSALKSILSNPQERPKLVGVFDADQGNAIETGLGWPTICLPGHSNPDEDMRHFLQSKAATAMAGLLRIDRNEYMVALGGLEGMDSHDWLKGLTEGLHISYRQFFQRVTPSWIAENSEMTSRFMKELRECFGLK